MSWKWPEASPNDVAGRGHFRFGRALIQLRALEQKRERGRERGKEKESRLHFISALSQLPHYSQWPMAGGIGEIPTAVLLYDEVRNERYLPQMRDLADYYEIN